MKFPFKASVRFVSLASPSKWERFVPKSGTYPAGYQVGAVNCGVKPKSTKLDLAVLVSTANSAENPTTAAAVYTTNKFQAAPVVVTRKVLEESQGQNIQAVIINSGCANAITGSQGLKDAETMVDVVDTELGTKGSQKSSLVMSTGVIGQLLPMERIVPGIKKLLAFSSKFDHLGSSHEHWESCAKGMMTTDTFPKLVSRTITVNGMEYKLAGLAKGAGMISPNMATLLGYLVTDAAVSPTALKAILQYAVHRSFNCVSVDGDMSTNDTIAALANGAAVSDPAAHLITEESPEYDVFKQQFTEVAQELAKLLVRDGEGATKFVTLNVTNCSSFEVAKKIAASIANSSLVKTALYGSDANWGRILAAIGYVDLGNEAANELDLKKISLSFIPQDGSQPLVLLNKGEPQLVDEKRASEILSVEDLEILVDIGNQNGHNCQYWTCDLSHDYVTINGDYRS